jgi:hypothetical protein
MSRRLFQEDGWTGGVVEVGEASMITITAFKWVPPFAQGQVRDHRVRWVLNEVG